METPTRFLIGVGGFLTFRGSGFEFKVVAISARGDIAIIKLESGETIAMLFMPRYRCIGVEGVLSGYELTKFIANKSAVVKGVHVLNSHRLAVCRRCGFKGDRDSVGALNIWLRALQAYAGVPGSLQRASAVKDEARRSGGTKMRG